MICGSLGFDLDLAAQTQDQHVDAAVENFGPVDSCQIEKLITRQHPLRLLHERGEQGVFRLGQIDITPFRRNQSLGGQIELPAGETDDRPQTFRSASSPRPPRPGEAPP